MRDRIQSLLRHCYRADESPVAQAHIWDDWVRALGDLPFDAVDAACIRYLRDPASADDKGRQIRPAIGQIRRIALEEQSRLEFAKHRYLPAPERLTGEPAAIAGWRMNHDTPANAWHRWSTYSPAHRTQWNAERQAWFDSPDYPKPPEKCRTKAGDETVAAYWNRTGENPRWVRP